MRFKNLYVFSDSHLILLFSSSNFALQFDADKFKKFKANIAFKDRNITCEVQYSFFSPFEKTQSDETERMGVEKTQRHSFGFLGLKITDIQEEDKRYLYESVFSNHYGDKVYA